MSRSSASSFQRGLSPKHAVVAVVCDHGLRTLRRLVLASYEKAAIVAVQPVEPSARQLHGCDAVPATTFAEELNYLVGSPAITDLANSLVDFAEEKLISPISIPICHDRTSGFAPKFYALYERPSETILPKPASLSITKGQSGTPRGAALNLSVY